MAKSTELRMFFFFTEKHFSLSVYVDDIKMSGKKQKYASHVEEIDEQM